MVKDFPPQPCAGPRSPLTDAELRQFAKLRVMMMRDVPMSRAQRMRWFDFWRRYDR
jgi:hypothetical protein